jgi:hypothetical protein
MSTSLEEALQACLEQIDQGADKDTALAAYPAIRSELGPLLETALAAADAGAEPVPTAAAMRSRTRILGRASELRSRHSATRGRAPSALRLLAAAVAGVLLVIVSGAGLLFASAQSLPGERLYPVKRAAEAARIRFTVSERNRISLAISYDHRRLDEVRQLLARGRQVEVEYEGILTEQTGSLWLVQGVPALALPESNVEQGLQIGDFIAIQGYSTDQGWVRADSIAAAGYLIEGTVDSIGKATWTVAGERLTVVEATEVDAGIGVGDKVEATVHLADGESIAIRILLLTPAVTPTPLPTPGLQATEAPAPSTEPKDDEREQEDERPNTTATPLPETTSTHDGEHEGEHEDEHETSEATATPEGQETEFSGVVEAINGSVWTIDGRTVMVDSDTRYEGDPGLGDDVRVRAIEYSDGTLLAEKIEVDD